MYDQESRFGESERGEHPKPEVLNVSHEQNLDLENDNIRARGLRQQPRVQYTSAALPTEISMDDEPYLSDALKYPERENWVRAIADELITLQEL